MFISSVNDTGDKMFGAAVSTTRLTNLSAVSLTPAIYLCHGFSLIGGAPVLLIPEINFSPVSLTPLKNDRQ
jgi:hypothetical protein